MRRRLPLPVPTCCALAACVALAACGGAQVQPAPAPAAEAPAAPAPEPAASPAFDPRTGRPLGEVPVAAGADPDLAARADAEARAVAADLRAGGDLEAGRARLRSTVATGAASALAYYNLAVADLRAGDFPAAEQHAWQAVELSEGGAPAVRLYVEAMTRWGRTDALVANLDGLAERFPDRPAAALGSVEARLAARQPADALRKAMELLRKDETNTDLMIAMARAWMALDRAEAAEYALAQALEIRKDPRAYALLGTLSWKRGDARKALVYYQEAVRLDPTLADVHNNLSVLYQDAGDAEAAARSATEALRLDPAYRDAWLNLGNARRVQRDFAGALAAYREAQRIDPDCADCEFNLGVAELENRPPDQDEPGHWRRAIEHLQRYKGLRRGTVRSDPAADAYIDEARRMAEFLEGEARRAKEAPPAEAAPAGAPPAEVPPAEAPVPAPPDPGAPDGGAT